jgi:hypothetical protein
MIQAHVSSLYQKKIVGQQKQKAKQLHEGIANSRDLIKFPTSSFFRSGYLSIFALLFIIEHSQ